MKTLVVHRNNNVKDVHRAQFTLAGHNRFNHRTYWNVGDSRGNVYDATMGRASVLMKDWLGYAREACVPTYGTLLDNYLTGKARLTPQMILRRIARGYQKPIVRKGYINPVRGPGKVIGLPGQGTHSWSAPPNNWQSDNAIDIACTVGTPLVAVCNGKIGDRLGPISHDGGRFAGIRLYLDDTEVRPGNQFYYAHLSRVIVKPFQLVKKGQILGYSGVANGVAHLHIAEMHGNPYLDLV